MGFDLACHVATSQGRSTKPNMDRTGFTRRPSGEALLVVADGMGGHADGATAAEIAVATLIESFEKARAPWGAWLRETIFRAHEAIVEQTTGPEAAMGSTVVAVVLEQTRAIVAHLGDSRALLVRGDFVYRLTSDHLAIVEPSADHEYEALVEENRAKGHHLAHILSRCLGAGMELVADQVAIHEVERRDGDVFLLYSDGVSEFVDEQRMHAILHAARLDPKATADTIVADAIERGSRDHSTALVAVTREG